MTFAMLRRIFTGRHPFSPDRGHLHHRLIDMGFNQKQTVRILYAVSALLGVSSIMFVTQKIFYAIIIIAVSLAVSVATWIIFKDGKMKYESGLMTKPGENEHENEAENKVSAVQENENENTHEETDNALNIVNNVNVSEELAEEKDEAVFQSQR
jgi:UDP-GlcNAc:undecaprenyl-phosphate GlcNAc-1-phosphate transferase